MSTMNEIKSATAALPPEEQFEIWKWLAESNSVRSLGLADLRREIQRGIAQADAGELHDADTVFADLRQRAITRPAK